MSINISVEGTYRLSRRKHASNESQQDFRFFKALPSGRTVEMTLSYASETVVARIDRIGCEEAIAEELEQHGRFDGEKLSREAGDFTSQLLLELHGAVRHLLALVRYHLRHFDLTETSFAVTSEKWGREGGTELRAIPTQHMLTMDNFSSWPLDDASRGLIQDSLNAGIEPLTAMRHLHRAKNETAAHHKWIDATTAAELAVKEVLCRVRPDIEVLLLETPSPPFAKMYGPILKHYLGEESPYRKQLIAGQEQRNRLVHRPNADRVDGQAAIDYVAMVEAAIFHLLSLAYPEDRLIRAAYRQVRSTS